MKGGERERKPAHAVVHALHEAQAVTAQSIGQVCVEQGEVSLVTSHVCPPDEGFVWMLRVRDAAPLPHEVVQVLQPLQEDIPQSTGHAASPQSERVCTVAAQLPPAPCAATRTVLTLEEVLGPAQLTEHADQLVQSSKEQSTGHS